MSIQHYFKKFCFLNSPSNAGVTYLLLVYVDKIGGYSYPDRLLESMVDLSNEFYEFEHHVGSTSC